MILRASLLTGLGVVVAGVAAQAQTDTLDRSRATASSYLDRFTGITLDDAIARALDQEPGLRAVRSQIDVARGLQSQAGLRPNPSMTFSQQEEPAGTDRQTRVEVSWPLDLSRKTSRVDVASREIEVAASAAADRERTLSADVRMKYGEVTSALRSLSTLESVLAATNRQASLLGSRVEEGAAPRLDRDLVRVEARRLEGDRLIQVGVVERRLVELKRLLGIPAGAPLTLAESLEELVARPLPNRPPLDDRQAASARSDVREAEARAAVAGAEIERAQSEARPDLSLFGMYMRSDAGFPQRGFGPTGDLERVQGVFHYVAAGAMVTLPLRNRNQGAIAAARARQVGAVAELDAARLSAESEIAAARARDQLARRALEAYTGEAMVLAKQNLETIRQASELGRGTQLDVLAEQRRYLDLERAHTEVLREAYEARQSLAAALGAIR